MADLAVLGLQIESKPAVQAANDLNTMAAAAGKAEKAVDGAGAASERAAARMSNASKGTERMLAAMERMEKAVREQSVGLGNAGAASARLEAQIASMAQGMAASAGKIETALQRAADAQEKFFNGSRRPPADNDPFRPTIKSADELRAKYDQLFAIGLKYRKSVEEIRAAEARGEITSSTRDTFIARAASDATAAQDAYVRMGRGLGAVNDNAKLTGNQLQVLSFQINDMATMALSGASAFQILATQGGQVAQVLGESEGGIAGGFNAMINSAKDGTDAINSFLSGASTINELGRSFGVTGTALLGLAKSLGALALNPIVLGVAALTAGIVYLATRASATDKALEASGKAAKAYSDAIKTATQGNSEFAASIDAARNGALRLTSSQAQAALMADIEKQKEAVKAAKAALASDAKFDATGGYNPLANIRDIYRQATGNEESSKFLDGLGDRLSKVAGSAAQVRAELQEFKVRPDLPDYLKDAADSMITLATQIAEGEANMKALTDAAARFRREQAQARFDDAQKGLNGFIPDRTTTRQQIEAAYALELRTSRGLGRTAGEPEEREAAALLRKKDALAEVYRAESVIREGRKLDLRDITARSVAERAQIAAERERLALSGTNMEASERAAAIEAARQKVLQQGNFDLTEAMGSRIRAGNAQVEQARQEIDLFGKSAGEVARLRAETEMLAQAKEAARQAGTVVDPSEEAAIRAQADAIGTLTDQLTRLNLGQDQQEAMERLQAEAGLIGMNAEARKVALAGLDAELQLRRQGISVNEAWGKSYVDNAKSLAAMEVSLDKQQDSFEKLHDTARDFFDALSSGKGILEGLIDAFAGLGKQLASAGFDKVFGQLFGKGGSASAPGFTTQFAGTAGSIAASVAAAGTQLPPIVTGEGFSASKAATVAGQSVPARIWNFFAGKGLAPHQIAGIMGNAKAESGYRPGAVGDGGAALGLFQWNDRGPAMRQFVGADWRNNLDGQLNFAWKELQTSENRAYTALLKATNVTQATEAFLGFERPYGHNTGVKNSHNYSGRVQNANEAFAEYSGQPYRQTSSIDERRAQTKAVSDGVVDANRQLAGDNWEGLRTVTPGAVAGTSSMGGMLSPRVQAGLSVLGAGIGSFSNGYQSGSPFSGGLSGAFSGYQAGGAISSLTGLSSGVSGILGGVGGMALGILGGILGGRAQRKAQHQAAAAEWDKVRPAYQEFDRSLSGEGTGELRSMITGLWSQLEGFMEKGGAAWKYGKGNSSAQFAATGTKMFERWAEEIHEFQDGFQYMLEDLTSGQGLQGAFANGRAQVKKLDESIKGFIDDVEVAFGSNDIGIPTSAEFDAMSERTKADREKRVEEAKRAAGEYALTMLYTAETQTEVEKALDSFKGTAAGLFPILTKLGWSAEEASKAIDERLTAAIDKMRGDFEKDVADRISDLKGEGYLSEVRDFLKEFETLQADAGRLGADTSNFGELFKLQLQGIVDGAELTGTAFDDLVKAFPQLAGVVHSFVENATRTAAQIAADNQQAAQSSYEAASSQLQSFYDRLKGYAEGLTSFLDGLKLDDLSTLSQKDQVTEAERIYRETLAKANAGDQDAQGKLTGAAQDYLDEARQYFASSADYGAIFDQVKAELTTANTKATTELDMMRSQARWLEDTAKNTLTTAEVLQDFVDAQKALNVNRSWGVEENRNKAIVSDLAAKGIDYSGNFGGGQFQNWTNAQLPSMQAIIYDIVRKWDQVYGVNQAKQLGGIVGRFAEGGMVGNGIWNRDSVLARYAGGGNIALAGGEFVMPAPRVTPQTMPMLEAMRSGRSVGNDNSALLAEIRGLRDEVRTLKTVTAQGAIAVKTSVDEGNAIQREGVGEQKRRNAA